MRYFKRNWGESRGDAHDEWGTSTWYFETAADLWPTRQMEVYANGTVLQYDADHVEDEYGGLSEAALEVDDFAPYAITQADFERAWTSHVPTNK
ncbi:hypothetical protein [Polaromonas aquatica]|uniref:hypothetical protein n=1 Tax=Polaromonas aquatica TaxID=332657 RepID=UPI003D661183